ncbi:MAG: Asp23/Gls24 family envelope stress response protein [Parachlamydiaceae bacterium]|nr:Asp23/Gls24 family envelope stress response protein [Parachlamydiaceae bacterium]
MDDKGIRNEAKRIDTKEFELPETTFSHDIDNKVFQGIILQCLASIENISLIEGNFIDSILGRSGPESIKGIVADQDNKNQSVNIKLEVNICYGVSIPEKAEEIQVKIAEEIMRLTGLHVASIHVIFKSAIPYEQLNKSLSPLATGSSLPTHPEAHVSDDYSDEF